MASGGELSQNGNTPLCFAFSPSRLHLGAYNCSLVFTIGSLVGAACDRVSFKLSNTQLAPSPPSLRQSMQGNHSKEPEMGVSENRGPEYSPLNSRILMRRTRQNKVPP